MFVEPARGVPDFLEVRNALAEVGYEGFAIVEQDMYPAPFDKPFPIAKRTRVQRSLVGHTCPGSDSREHTIEPSGACEMHSIGAIDPSSASTISAIAISCAGRASR